MQTRTHDTTATFPSPLSLEIEGKRKFIGQLGQYKGNRVFRVDRPITPKDRV